MPYVANFTKICRVPVPGRPTRCTRSMSIALTGVRNFPLQILRTFSHTSSWSLSGTPEMRREFLRVYCSKRSCSFFKDSISFSSLTILSFFSFKLLRRTSISDRMSSTIFLCHKFILFWKSLETSSTTGWNIDWNISITDVSLKASVKALTKSFESPMVLDSRLDHTIHIINRQCYSSVAYLVHGGQGGRHWPVVTQPRHLTESKSFKAQKLTYQIWILHASGILDMLALRYFRPGLICGQNRELKDKITERNMLWLSDPRMRTLKHGLNYTVRLWNKHMYILSSVFWTMTSFKWSCYIHSSKISASYDIWLARYRISNLMLTA